MKKSNILLFAMVILLSLTGCQLARTDLEPSKDRLVGVFITEDYLDLFDMEAYLNDNLNLFQNDLIIDGDTSAYQGRIYATIGSHKRDISFDGLDGIHFIAAREEENGECYNAVYTGEGLIQGKTAYNYTDEAESVSISGEIWMAHRPGSITSYINPVYQDSDGNYYVTAGLGFSTNIDNAVGGVYGQTLEETHTITENGEQKTISVSISISLGTMYEPESFTIHYMDSKNQLLRSDIFLPGNMPEKLLLTEDIAYLILEIHNHYGEPIINRQLFDPEADHIKTLYAGENGYMLEDLTVLEWP